MTRNNVAVIGSGGREHALAWKLAQSDDVGQVYIFGGNECMAYDEKIAIQPAQDYPGISSRLSDLGIALTVVGPEAPLVDGLVDKLEEDGHRVFGPSAAAARLEADKFFSYDVMDAAGIAQARGVQRTSLVQARGYLGDKSFADGIVLKARGLAGGKGVSVCDSLPEAKRELERIVNAYGPEILISERLFGEEFSVFAFCDGKRAVPINIAFQDHKRAYDGDKGPNTGGMGAYGPVFGAELDAQYIEQVQQEVLDPLMATMSERGTPFKGFLYAGMMETAEGLKVIEFNVRFGDPECQPAMMMLDGDLYHILQKSIDGELTPEDVRTKSGAACTVVMASQGYPTDPQKGFAIHGDRDIGITANTKVFYAGVKKTAYSTLASGGRVLGVTGRADTIQNARENAYTLTDHIAEQTRRANPDRPSTFAYRTDIAKKALER